MARYIRFALDRRGEILCADEVRCAGDDEARDYLNELQARFPAGEIWSTGRLVAGFGGPLQSARSG